MADTWPLATRGVGGEKIMVHMGILREDLKNPFLQLNIFATVGEFMWPKYITIPSFSLLYCKMADLQSPPIWKFQTHPTVPALLFTMEWQICSISARKQSYSLEKIGQPCPLQLLTPIILFSAKTLLRSKNYKLSRCGL